MENALYEDVMVNIFTFFNYNERARLKVICKRWNRMLSEMSTGKLVIFEYTLPFVDRLRLKNEYWTHTDTLQTKSVERLFRDRYFLHLSRTISVLVIFGNYFVQKSKTAPHNLIKFQNLHYLELYHCNYENLDSFKSLNITHLFLNKPCILNQFFTNFPSLQHVEITHLESISKFFNQKFSTNLLYLKTENYLGQNDIKRLIRYCPKLEHLNCKLANLHLVYTLINRLRHLKTLIFYTTDCAELSKEDKQDFRELILNKRSDLMINYCGVNCDDHSINFLFDFIQVKKYFNWSIIETNRLLDIMTNYSNELDYLDEYFLKMTKHVRIFGDVMLNDDNLILKLKNLKKLLVSRCSSKNVIVLISNLTNLRSLSLNSCFFKKSQYDLIPKHLVHLTELIINSCKISNFEFIHNLKNLQQVVLLLTKSINLENFLEIIQKCYYLVILRANVLHSVEKADDVIYSLSTNKIIRNKIIEFPDISFRFVLLHSNFLNTTEVSSETVIKYLE